MKVTIRPARPEEAKTLASIEAVCFPPAEAATREAFAYRIETFPERFFVAERQGRIIGLVNGCASDLPAIDDRLFEPQGHDPEGKNQMVFGLAVHPDCRNNGIAAALLRRPLAIFVMRSIRRS